jgi:NTE family protein
MYAMSENKQTTNRRKTLGLALGAGASCGAAHAGFLRALEESGIKADYVAGCSMGSVVGAAYAAGVDMDTMERALCSMTMGKLLSFTFKKGGISGIGKMRKVLLKHIGDVEFSQLKIPFRCVAVDMNSQKIVELSQGRVVDAAAASSCIPVAFTPIEKDGMRLVDGAVLQRVPARQVKNMGADVVVAVDVLGWRPPIKKRGAVSMALSIFDIMDNTITRKTYEENRDIIDFYLDPHLEEMSQYTFKQVRFAYQRGYELGKNNAEAIKKALE